MLDAKDSLINLRLGHKRPRPSVSVVSAEDESSKVDGSYHQGKSRTILPIEDLRAQVAAKRQRRCCGGGGASSSSPSPLDAPTGKGKDFVQFDTSRNVVHEIHNTREDLDNAWMSQQDTDRIRCHNLRAIALFRLGGGTDDDDDCFRGLELHATKELLEKKIKNGRNFTRAILQQQDFLRSMMGKANELMLGRMSAVLSQEDAAEAAQTGEEDAKVAAAIHGEATSSNAAAAATTTSRGSPSEEKAAAPPTTCLVADRAAAAAGSFSHQKDSMMRLLSPCPFSASDD